MRSCAFLSMNNLDAFECYDHLLFQPLKQVGWTVEEVSWRKEKVNWNQYDAVVIRSPWDYQEDAEAFLQVLKEIESSSALLENSLELVEWNVNKTYLRDLEAKGVEIVPTLWADHFNSDHLQNSFGALQSDEVVIKPTISAGADDTFRLNLADEPWNSHHLSETFHHRPYMIQPFMPHIVEEGEFSLFFFGEKYSHSILKTPQVEDFRVQEEHGGILSKITPPEYLLTSARTLLDLIEPRPLYTRADFVRTSQNTFALMELELVEPSLYFNMDPDSPQRFARVFNEWMKERL